MPRKKASEAEPATRAPLSTTVTATPAAPTKISTVLELLQRKQGATLAELVEATGWLPHTARAALTGLRKKGHAIERSQRDGTTTYRINQAA